MLGLKMAQPPQGLPPPCLSHVSGGSSGRLQRACRSPPDRMWWLASVTVIFLPPGHGFQPASWILLEWFLESECGRSDSVIRNW